MTQPTIDHRDLMLATPGKLFSAPGWIYELKMDGFRCLISKSRKVVRLESRNGNNMADRFPGLVAELQPIPHVFVADAELVILDETGCPQWTRLKKRHAQRSTDRVRRAAIEDPAALFLFDLLWLNAADLRARTLLERKSALHGIVPGNRRIRYTNHFADSSAELWSLANELELEGLMAKRADSIYTAGRSNSWQKIKTDVGAARERARRPK